MNFKIQEIVIAKGEIDNDIEFGPTLPPEENTSISEATLVKKKVKQEVVIGYLINWFKKY